MNYLETQSSSRISTRTWVKGKKLIPIEVAKIRPTGPMDWDIKEIRYSPICLIRDVDNDCYYIVDGNHRFFTKLLVHKSKIINAWVLEEGDQQKLRGNPLPTRLGDWKNGEMDFHELCLMAREAYKINEDDINRDFELCGRKTDEKEKFESFVIKTTEIQNIDLRNLAIDICCSILKIIEGKTSLEVEAIEKSMNGMELAKYYKCFIDGGIKAIEEKLRASKRPKI